jgi:hypothetical protein
MAKLDALTILSITTFIGFVCSILLALSVITNNKVNNENNNCDSGPSDSNPCAIGQCIKSKFQDTFEIPLCCSDINECLLCDPFGIYDDVTYVLDNAITNVISNTNCTNDIYVQQSIITSNNLIVECFNTFPDSMCQSSLGVMTINATMFVNYIEENNETFVNMNNFLINGGTFGYFNVSNGTALIDSLTVNGTLYIDVIDSCVNDSVIIDGLVFYDNGTLVVPNANVTQLNISIMNDLTIIGGIDVQGVLISRGTVQGYSGGQPSNILFNPTSMNVGFGYSQQDVNLEKKLNVNGTVATRDFLFYPNNCTEQADCTIDYFYEWTGYLNVSGFTNNTSPSIPIKVVRMGREVTMMLLNISGYVTGNPLVLSGSFANSSGPTAFNYTNFINPTRTVNQNINFWVPSINLAVWAQVTIDPQAVMRIYVNPYYSFSSTAFYWNRSTLKYNMP